MKRAPRLLLLVLILLGAALAWLRFDDGRKEEATAPVQVRDGVPAPDSAAVPASAVPHPPASAWLEARTRRYAGLFKNQDCAVLVVPVQVEGSAFDRPNRDIMGADLALSLAAPDTCVIDPLLADIALGDGLRRRDGEQVLALARAVKAKRIVQAYAGHGLNGHMRVTLQVMQFDPAGRSAQPAMTIAHSFEGLQFDESQPPFAVFHARLPQMLQAVGLAGLALSQQPAGALPEQLPNSPDDYLHPQPAGPLAQSARLAFLAMLAPSRDWRSLDRLFSKAWVALQGADAADPEVRLMRARILFHLEERPYALAQLGQNGGPAADGLRAVLNGNLPQARKALAGVGNPWERLFLGIEVHDLEASYERDPRSSAARAMSLVAEPWKGALGWRLGDRDMWTTGSSFEFKALLDRYLPIPGYSIEDFKAGRDAPSSRAEAEMTALRHVYRLVEEQPRLWCCGSFSATAQASDLLDLFDSRIEYVLGRQASYYYRPQDAPDTALEMLKSYDAVLSGSPCADALRVAIYEEQHGRGERGKDEELERRVREYARAATWWEQGQTSDSATGLWYLYQEPQDATAPYLIKYTDDYPVRSYWRGHGHVPIVPLQLDFSVDDPWPLQELIKGSAGAERQRYVDLFETRFVGGPNATQARLDNLPAERLTPEYLRGQIADDPDNYRYYTKLAHLQVDRFDFAGASRTILSYPAFHDEDPYHPVELGNHASSWGHSLFWLGAFDGAKPLFKFVADLDNGSAASHRAKARLALLANDYSTAAASFLDSAQHYDNMFDYREFVDLGFASGQDRSSWALFDRLTGKYEAVDLWWAADTGLRKAGADTQARRDWVRQRLSRLPAEARSDDLYSLALQQELIDRVLPTDFAASIAELAGTTGQRLLPGKAGRDTSLTGAGAFGRDRHPKTPPAQLPNRYAVLAEAMAAQRAGRDAEAVAAFDRLSASYKLEDGSLAFALPYFALAASRSGDSLGLQGFLDGIPQSGQSYEVQLARAVFLAAAGKHEEARAELDRAFLNWPVDLSLRNLWSPYDYLYVCASLFESTHDARYQQAALRLGRILRRTEPTLAYGHALVAYLGESEEERTEALAMALYLDPHSRWAALAPATLRAGATAWSRHHPLFVVDSVWQVRATEAAGQ